MTSLVFAPGTTTAWAVPVGPPRSAISAMSLRCAASAQAVSVSRLIRWLTLTESCCASLRAAAASSASTPRMIVTRTSALPRCPPAEERWNLRLTKAPKRLQERGGTGGHVRDRDRQLHGRVQELGCGRGDVAVQEERGSRRGALVRLRQRAPHEVDLDLRDVGGVRAAAGRSRDR